MQLSSIIKHQRIKSESTIDLSNRTPIFKAMEAQEDVTGKANQKVIDNNYSDEEKVLEILENNKNDISSFIESIDELNEYSEDEEDALNNDTYDELDNANLNQELRDENIISDETEFIEDNSLADELAQKRQQLEWLEEEIQSKIKEAEQIILDAEEQARQKIEEANLEVSTILEEGKRIQEELNSNIERQKEQLNLEIQNSKIEAVNSADKDIANTIISLTRAIVGDELNHNIEWIKWMARKIILKESLDNVKLLISPNNYNQIKDMNTWSNELGKVTSIEEDETLSDTVCVLETSEGSIEYDVHVGLEKLISEIRIMNNLV